MVTSRKMVEVTIGMTEALGRRTWTVGGRSLVGDDHQFSFVSVERPTEVIQVAT